MAVLFDFQACRGCLAPNINGTFTSLFENPENAARFDSIAEVSIADDKDEFAALICDSCFDEVTQVFELRRNLRFLEKISFETRRVKDDLQEIKLDSNVDKNNNKSGENAGDVTSNSRKSTSNNAQKELPRLREFYVRIERLEDVNESFDQPRASNLEKGSAKTSEFLKKDRIKSHPKRKAEELDGKVDGKTDRGSLKRQFRNSASNLAGAVDEDKFSHSSKLINNGLIPKDSIKSIKCQICQKLLINKTSLKSHMETVHQNLKNFICRVCGWKFAQRGNLRQHIKLVHDKIKDLKCDLCDYKTSRKGNLQRHIVRHLGNSQWNPNETNRPFKCSVENCSEFYSSKAFLDRHKKTHSDGPASSPAKVAHRESVEKSIKCQTCQKSFMSKDNLRRHFKQVHQEIKKFGCKICGYKCYRKDNLLQHLRAVHRENNFLKCDLCDFKSSVRNNLQKHIARHIKNPNFKSSRDTSNSNRPFKCEVENCGKYFECEVYLKRHKKTHSDSRPFVCSTCKITFKTKGNLFKHQENVDCSKKVRTTKK